MTEVNFCLSSETVFMCLALYCKYLEPQNPTVGIEKCGVSYKDRSWSIYFAICQWLTADVGCWPSSECTYTLIQILLTLFFFLIYISLSMWHLILGFQAEISTSWMMALNQLAQEGYPCHHGSTVLQTAVNSSEDVSKHSGAWLFHCYTAMVTWTGTLKPAMGKPLQW